MIKITYYHANYIEFIIYQHKYRNNGVFVKIVKNIYKKNINQDWKKYINKPIQNYWNIFQYDFRKRNQSRGKLNLW